MWTELHYLYYAVQAAAGYNYFNIPVVYTHASAVPARVRIRAGTQNYVKHNAIGLISWAVNCRQAA